MKRRNPYESLEWRPGDRAGVRMIATEAGVAVDWGERERTFNPEQARQLAAQLTRAASEAEKRGAKEWLIP